MASCYDKLGGHDLEAIDCYEEVIRQKPYFLRANLRLANIYERVLITNKAQRSKGTDSQSARDCDETMYKAYLDCVLRANTLARSPEDSTKPRHHLDQFQKYFPSIWARWVRYGGSGVDYLFWAESGVEEDASGIATRRLVPNNVCSIVFPSCTTS